MSHQALTRRGYVLKKKHLDQKDIKKINRDLTFVPLILPAFANLARPKKFCTYLESELRYYLPRYYAIENFGPPKKNHLDEGLTKIDVEFYWDLFPHQDQAWQALYDQFIVKQQGGIFSVYCGGGKTILAIKLIIELGYKAIVVVNKEFLMKQWKTAIEACSDARVGIIQRNKIDVEDKDIIIAMLHSISMKDYPDHVFNGIGFSLYDECHHIASNTFSQSLPKIACKYTLGLSATPIRKDGLTQVFLNYLGPLFYTEKRSGTNRVWVKFIEVKSESSSYKTEIMEFTGTKDTGKMITNISKFEAMNHLILEICRTLLQNSGRPRKILVLGSRREQLEWLNASWDELSYKNAKGKYATSGLYYGNQKMNKKLYWNMLEASAKCDVIFGTNDIAKEGLDLPDLNTLILLSGGRDVEQAVGRILRKHHEQTPPIVIDLVYKCGNFTAHARARRDFYDYENYIMHKLLLTITDDEESVYQQTAKIEKFLNEYPSPGDPGVLPHNKNAKNPNLQEIPLANHPPELKSIPTIDANAPKKQISLLKKSITVAKPSIPTEKAPRKKKEGDWLGFESDEEEPELEKNTLYLSDSEDESERHARLTEKKEPKQKEKKPETLVETPIFIFKSRKKIPIMVSPEPDSPPQIFFTSKSTYKSKKKSIPTE